MTQSSESYAIKDLSLAPSGRAKIDWVRGHMPILSSIEKRFAEEKPLKGAKVALSVHLEAKTAYLCETLRVGGAEMFITGSNPLSTQDDVAAALVEEGMSVYAWHGVTEAEYAAHIAKVISSGPNIIIDDGGDLVGCIHNEFPELIKNVWGGCEETTTGVKRLQSLAARSMLAFPMILVNNADSKHLFDNRYGTGQSVWDGINRTTNLIVAGKTVVVCGYGWCGKGVSMRAKGLGAKVIVTEIDPIKAMEAVMDGFDVKPLMEAAPLGDIFVTVTGCCDVIGEKAFLQMKNGVILANAGHFDVEVDVACLKRIAVRIFEQKPNIMGYELANGKVLSVLAEGRLVNIAAGDGHPAEIMDMSFAIQALCAAWIVANRPTEKIIDVPREIDQEVARMKLAFDGYRIDTLTQRQVDYLNS